MSKSMALGKMGDQLSDRLWKVLAEIKFYKPIKTIKLELDD